MLGGWSRNLNLELPHPLPSGEPKLSAVMALIGWNPISEQDEILLTKRTDKVETHKGQISFPGGFWSIRDAHLLATALRESQEEIGLDASSVTVLGSLKPVVTQNQIRIFPWVGTVEFSYPFQRNEAEVASILYLPVQRLLEEGLKSVQVQVHPNLTVESKGIWLQNELVWGATAQMLDQLRDKILRNP